MLTSIMFSPLIVFLGVLAKNILGQVIEIGKPQFKCEQDGQINREIKQVTEIRLPENNYALYSVNTERATSCTDIQNCYLVSWRIIRDFEIYLNRNFPNTGDTGIIFFDNIMLIPGFNYLLHVTLKTPDKKIEKRNYNLSFYIENDTKINLLGRLDLNSDTDKFYSTLPIIINANVTFCGQFDSYYYFRWSIDINNTNILLPGKSRELSIMSNTTKDKFVIHCEVVTCDNDTTILQENMQIDIIQAPSDDDNESFEIFLPFKFSTISKGASIFIQSSIGKLNGNKNYKAEWSCMLENTLLNDCLGQRNYYFFLETGFYEEGNYTIILTVRTNSLEKSATCNILVLSDVPSINFNVSFPIKAENGIEINAKITKLKTYCTVNWAEDHSNQFGLENIPGISTTTFNISAKDKSFLEDIMEFGHLTVTRNFKLKIPGPSRFWNGLESGSYKINLAVTCPLVQEISNETGIYEEPPKNFFTIKGQTELIVPNSTNNIESLNIFSDGNVALVTTYYFEIKKYLGDIETSRLHKFGFILEGLEIVFYSAIDVSNANTILPYNGDIGVESYVEVCDYKDRCNKKFGPLIKTSLNENLNEREIFKTFTQLLVEENFYKLFSYAFIVFHSSSFINQRKKYEKTFSTILLEKVRKLSDGNSNLILSNLKKHLIGFSGHLKLTDEFMKLISEVSQESELYTRIVREVSKENRNEEILDVFENQLNIPNSSNETVDYPLNINRRHTIGVEFELNTDAEVIEIENENATGVGDYGLTDEENEYNKSGDTKDFFDMLPEPDLEDINLATPIASKDLTADDDLLFMQPQNKKYTIIKSEANTWKKYNPSNLQNTPSKELRNPQSTPKSKEMRELERELLLEATQNKRRRPATVVRALKQSNIAAKYGMLVEKRLEIANMTIVEFHQKTDEHLKKMELLDLEIAIKKRQLNR